MRTPFTRSRQAPAGRRRLIAVAIAVLSLLSAALIAVPVATATTSRNGHHRRLGRHHARTASACANANDTVRSASVKRLRRAVVCLINQQRAAHQLPPLHASLLLDRSAQRWTNSMVAAEVFSHGTNFGARISAVGYVWRDAGENIATGFETPRSVVNAWMGSTGHCENILNPTYRDVGTGVSSRVVSGWATGAGTWTQDFALGVKQSPPSGNWGPAHGCPY
jgi:uncharacterized protein YkwD